MTKKLENLYKVLGTLREEMSEEEAKGFLRQAKSLFVDLSPTEIEDAIFWLADCTCLGKSWLKAYKKEITQARAECSTTKVEDLRESYRLHPAVDFPPQGRYMTLGFRVEGPNAENLLLLSSDGASVQAHVNPDSLEFQGMPWTLGSGTPPWLPDRWSLPKLKSFIKNPVPPVDLFSQLKETMAIYLDMPEPTYGLMAAWVVGTYMAHQFAAYPFLHLLGPKESGKTKALETMLHLCFNPFKGRDISVAALGDTCDGQRGTVLFDQAERLCQGDNGNGHLVGILADSYKKAGGKRRVVMIIKGVRTVLEFSPYGPKAFASTKALDPDLADRCIRLPMTRTLKRLPDLEGWEPVWGELRDACYRFTLLCFHEVARAYAAIPGISTRVRELWRPIGAVLQVLRADLQEIKDIERFFLDGAAENRHEVDPWEEALLETLREKAMAAKGPFQMTSEEILDAMGINGEAKPGRIWLGNALSRFSLYAKKLPRRNVEGDRRRKVQPYLFDPQHVIRIWKTYIREFPQNGVSSPSFTVNDRSDEGLHETHSSSGTRPSVSPGLDESSGKVKDGQEYQDQHEEKRSAEEGPMEGLDLREGVL
ncbi:MAG: hypothetical protein WHT07_08760 [Desulfobaccales bacterium]